MNTQITRQSPTSTLVALSLCMALQMTGFVMILPLFARRFESFGAGVEALGLSAMAYALTSTVAAPFIGMLADCFGRRPIILLSLSAYVLAFSGYLFASSSWMMILPEHKARVMGIKSTVGLARKSAGPRISSGVHAFCRPSDCVPDLSWIGIDARVDFRPGIARTTTFRYCPLRIPACRYKSRIERTATMSEVLIAFSTWLHALATVVFIGHFVLLALIYLPAVKDKPDIPVGAMLGEFSKRSRVWMYVALLIFMITGIHLMFVDPNYLGIGDFGNFWSILMLVKHILILGMILAGFWFNSILRVGPMLSSKTGSAQAFHRFRSYVNGMAIAGILILLLTAISQVK